MKVVYPIKVEDGLFLIFGLCPTSQPQLTEADVMRELFTAVVNNRVTYNEVCRPKG